MSDRFSGSVSVFGKVNRSTYTEIEKLLEELPNFEIDEGIMLSGYFSDGVGSDFDELKAAIKKHDLWLWIQWDGHYDFSAFVEYFHNDEYWEYRADNDGVIHFSIHELAENPAITVQEFLDNQKFPDCPCVVEMLDDSEWPDGAGSTEYDNTPPMMLKESMPQLPAEMLGVVYENVMGGLSVDLCEEDMEIDELMEKHIDPELVCVVPHDTYPMSMIKAIPDMLTALVRLQVALGDFCCAFGISYDDMEDEHKELLDASNAADELIKQVKGVL